MAYKSLYRTYRPQTFADVSGQEAIITTLKHAIKENKIAHAYLFCGPRGTGKTSVAKLFAKAVNCSSDDAPCGKCENCKAIEKGTHQDVIEIDAASNNGVEEVRDLIEKVKYAPVQGKYKVYIIDEVHMMSTGAFNALLKTLEEPPAHVIFILATTEPHKILPTIISRCQRFDFSRLTDQEIVGRMETVMKEEGKTYDEGALSLIAKLANGGMRDALSILEQCLAYNDDHLTEEDVNSIYGIVSLSDKIDLIKVILSKDMNRTLDIIHKMDSSGIDVKRLTYDLIDILKDVVIYKNTHNVGILSVLSEGYIDSIVPYITSDDALSFIDILLAATEKYARSVNPDIYFELAILKLCNQDHNVQVVEVEKKAIPENKVKIVEGKPAEEPAPIVEEKEVEEPTLVVEEKEVEETSIVNEKPVEEEKPVFQFEEKEEVEKHDDNIEVDQADIMNILVQADRHILNRIQEKWPIVKRYMANMNTAKAACMLASGKPVAACQGGLVISYEFMPEVNAVNYYKNYKQLASLLHEIFNEDYRFVAMQEKEWLAMRNHFIELMKKKALPKPGPIVLKHIDGHDLNNVEMSDAQKFAVDLFGSDLVEFSED
jgi:DNA polymerase-3 subunit gamma/tau